MTKLRPPVSSSQAMTRVVGVLTQAEMAAITGRSQRTHYEWSDPDSGTCPTIDQAIALDLAYAEKAGEGAPFHEYFSLKLQLAAQASTRSMVDLVVAIGAAAREGGEALDAALGASLPGATPFDREKACREIQEEITSLTGLLGKLTAEPPEHQPP